MQDAAGKADTKISGEELVRTNHGGRADGYGAGKKEAFWIAPPQVEEQMHVV